MSCNIMVCCILCNIFFSHSPLLSFAIFRGIIFHLACSKMSGATKHRTSEYYMWQPVYPQSSCIVKRQRGQHAGLVTRAASERRAQRVACIPSCARCGAMCGAVLCVVCLVSMILSPSRSLRTSLTSTRWCWVVEAPAAAPFDLPGHAPFFHFFHSLKGRWTKCIVKWAARSGRQRRWEGEREYAGGTREDADEVRNRMRESERRRALRCR